MSAQQRKISFPADSVLSAVIQDGDVTELHKILQLKRGEVNVNQTNHVGLTALHHAVLSNNIDAVKLLLCSGSDVNAQDVHGYTPLHMAAACNFLQISSLLLVFGADVFSPTTQSDLPVDITADINIIRLLTAEMYRKIHEKLYWKTLITSKLFYLWNTFRKLVMFVFNMLVIMCTLLWNICRRRTPNGDVNVPDIKKPIVTTKSNVPLNNNQIKRRKKPEKLD